MGETENMTSNSNYSLPSESTQLVERSSIPASPPPSYEHVLSESVTESPVDDGPEEEDEENMLEDNSNKQNEEVARPEVKRPQIIHKSSKELYKAVAAQWGITCKMSDHCRCLDCQSHYLDCEYDRDEQEKTDGGLGAGTPMFISEVMHGSACTLL